MWQYSVFAAARGDPWQWCPELSVCLGSLKYCNEWMPSFWKLPLIACRNRRACSKSGNNLLYHWAVRCSVQARILQLRWVESWTWIVRFSNSEEREEDKLHFGTNYKEKCKSVRWSAKGHGDWIAHRATLNKTVGTKTLPVDDKRARFIEPALRSRLMLKF